MTYNEITLDHVYRGYAAAKDGSIAEAVAQLSMALAIGRVDRIELTGAIRLSEEWEEGSDGGKTYEHLDIRQTVEEAYEDVISKRIPEAIAKLEEALYPDGVPAHVGI